MSIPVLASRVAEWAAIAVTAVGGGLYVGKVQTQGDVNTRDIANLSPVAAETARDIAKLEERTQQMQQGINDIKAQQNTILLILQKR